MENCINEGDILVEGISSAKGAVGGLVGYPTQAYHPAKDCKNIGNLTATCEVVFPMGGLFGDAGNSNQSYEGCSVNCTITAPASVRVGIITGDTYRLNSASRSIVYGTSEAPFKVKGTVNGTTLTEENFSSYLLGRGPVAGTVDTTNVQFGE